jgi:glycyl-tRNA synthetase beta subunit
MKPSKIPKDIYAVYEALYQEVCSVHEKWGIFCHLYEEKETVHLLNSSAPGFFRICQDALVNEVLLAITRITEPKQIGRKHNLSLEQLLSSIDERKYSVLRSRAERLLKKAETNSAFAKDVRNRRIAHSDFQTKLELGAEPLAKVTRKRIEGALEAICNLMNEVHEYFEDSSVVYETILLSDESSMLLARLREAKIYRAQLREFQASLLKTKPSG